MYNLSFFLKVYKNRRAKITKSSINEHLTRNLDSECIENSSLRNLAISKLTIGVTHPVWATVSSSVSDIRKAITKSRMLTGTYLLQAHRHRFNQAEVDPICPNCRTENEDLCHVLTTCPLYMNIRIALYAPILLLSLIFERKWTTCSVTMMQYVHSKKTVGTSQTCENIPNNPEILGKIENMSRIYCYEIHKKRLSTEI
ncbi:unnamed protein product [Mytilus edulis]|uniref:Reverse transcriptase zinc-binding domain-containing protein n=1 Tax=Mytilus edulis TaxID=6550 RepID=A0A8S3T486_MYTED|nr:unnamed protein product [Mytilus edulis]